MASVYAIIGHIRQFQVATSALCHTSLQIGPCCRHVHIFVLHNFLQLQYMMSSSSAGGAGLSVRLVDIFHPQCATPILLASYCHLFLSSSLHDSTLESCGTLQPLRSVAEYMVQHAMRLSYLIGHLSLLTDYWISLLIIFTAKPFPSPNRLHRNEGSNG